MSISGAGARLSEMSFGDYGEHLRMFPIGEKRFTRTHDGKTYSGRVHVTPLYHHLMLIAGDKRALFVKPPRKSKK
jgi:hypothetical protein